MLFNRVHQPTIGGTGAAIVQEENALPQTPQRRGAEFVGASGTLLDVVSQSGTHMVHEQV